jgi:hypothetical protein
MDLLLHRETHIQIGAAAVSRSVRQVKGTQMQYILSLLPVLACPVGMGLVMWLIMRMGKEQSPPAASPKEVDSPIESSQAMHTSPAPLPAQQSFPLKAIWECMQMCLNWKVLVGLAVIALGIAVAAPQFFFGALPILLVLACPISMLLMMGQMGKMQSNSRGESVSCPTCQEKPVEQAQEREQSARAAENSSPTSSLKW